MEASHLTRSWIPEQGEFQQIPENWEIQAFRGEVRPLTVRLKVLKQKF